MQKKQIKVKDLPEGYFKGQLTQLVIDPEIAVVWVVAKEGRANDWAAYIGWPTLGQLKPQFQPSSNYQYYCERVHFSNDVADRGDKLDEATAREIFPEITKRYRG